MPPFCALMQDKGWYYGLRGRNKIPILLLAPLSFSPGKRKPCPETFSNSGQGFEFDEFGVIELDLCFFMSEKSKWTKRRKKQQWWQLRSRNMIRAALSRARWHGRVPLSCFSPDFQPEKQDKSVHSSSFPRTPIISTKEILREHPQPLWNTHNSLIQPPPEMDLSKKWKWRSWG